MTRYLIVIEKADGNFSAYSPDIDGCVAAGETREEAIKNMQEAIQFHFDGMREDGLPLPEGYASAEYVAV
ncbi:MAG: type II toxin-antitoxin system HicB family antitoxin [Anaerolineales bacterium]|nr:MAG: type II toxin-antitoxin system HicB family antitoxin [Anaerolineales bacterium]